MNKLLFFASLLLSVSAAAQPQVLGFKELQQFLPQGDFQNYARGKMDGETSSMMGFATSWAQVKYSSSSDSNKCTVTIKITDMLNIPSYMSLPPSPSENPAGPTGSEHKKTVSYDSMNVVEACDSASHQAKLQVTLATRFLIEINGEGVVGPSVLYLFLDKTGIEGLRRIAQAGTNNPVR